MPVLQQQQPLRRQGGDRDLLLAGQPMVGRQGDHELIARHRQRVGAAAVAGQRQQQQVQPVGVQPIDQVGRRVLPQIQPQAREAARSAGISLGSRNGPMVGMTPSRSGPPSVRAPPPPPRSPLPARSARSRARSTSSSPSGVNTTCRPAARSRMWQSSCRSSASNPADRVDCVTAQACAARPKCRVSARATGSEVVAGWAG